MNLRENTSNIGMGFRRDIADAFLKTNEINPDFVEVAPENWINMGGYWGAQFKEVSRRFPVFLHGLSLSIGSPDELDFDFLRQVKNFIEEHDVRVYSEHLSFAKLDNAHLYDLLPIPFRDDSVKHVVDRINQVQDFLGMPIAIENVSYYTPVAAQMTESEFINQIVSQSGCSLLLDVNNVYVNAFNHHYDPYEFISGMPLDRVAYLHMAGHEQVSPTLIVDTHGEAIIHPVYDLFDFTVAKLKPVPVLLERDFNFPEIRMLNHEMNQLRSIVNKYWIKDVVPA